jgi:hypothetical protein
LNLAGKNFGWKAKSSVRKLRTLLFCNKTTRIPEITALPSETFDRLTMQLRAGPFESGNLHP